MNHDDIPDAYRYNAEALGEDARWWGFVRNSGLPRETFRDPADALRDVFLRWRWTAIAVLVLALIGAALTMPV